jgi:hypothetical protein
MLGLFPLFAVVAAFGLTGPVIAQSSNTTASSRQIFNFTTYVDIENSVLRPNGHLFLTTLSSANLYSLDPFTGNASIVAALPGNITALTGIVSLGGDRYALQGGVRGSYNYTDETLFVVDLSAGNDTTQIRNVSGLPSAVFLNGLAIVDENVVLAADSRLACLWRADLDTGIVTQSASDSATMGAPANASVPIGIDGLKLLRDNGTLWAYYTSVARLLVARVPLAADGSEAMGPAEVVELLPEDQDWDDFAFSADGKTVSVAVDVPEMAGGPTSVILVEEGRKAYVTTRGDKASGRSGQVFEVVLP